jgi:hypothetical protein
MPAHASMRLRRRAEWILGAFVLLATNRHCNLVKFRGARRSSRTNDAGRILIECRVCC